MSISKSPETIDKYIMPETTIPNGILGNPDIDDRAARFLALLPWIDATEGDFALGIPISRDDLSSGLVNCTVRALLESLRKAEAAGAIRIETAHDGERTFYLQPVDDEGDEA
jgi:hypothetical protein